MLFLYIHFIDKIDDIFLAGHVGSFRLSSRLSKSDTRYIHPASRVAS